MGNLGNIKEKTEAGDNTLGDTTEIRAMDQSLKICRKETKQT